ncbi:putative transmembrane protein [Nitrosomonas sp. Is79A3]|uniref:membrane protein n=1 Tax=Nitrosomonas sp. (strain Is79A3) TaxID=261292 RepID=UPI000215CB94
MRRIYFLVPDISITKRIVDDLLAAKIEDRHIHVIAKRGTPLEDLPEANLLQKSDFIPAVEQGLALGGTTGMLAGLVAVILPPASTVIAGGILLATTLVGAGVGAWVSGMVGMSIGNRRIKEFEDAVEAGHFLVLVDVPTDRVLEIERRVKQHLPEVEIEGTEPMIPVFP